MKYYKIRKLSIGLKCEGWIKPLALFIRRRKIVVLRILNNKPRNKKIKIPKNLLCNLADRTVIMR